MLEISKVILTKIIITLYYHLYERIIHVHAIIINTCRKMFKGNGGETPWIFVGATGIDVNLEKKDWPN